MKAVVLAAGGRRRLRRLAEAHPTAFESADGRRCLSNCVDERSVLGPAASPVGDGDAATMEGTGTAT